MRLYSLQGVRFTMPAFVKNSASPCISSRVNSFTARSPSKASGQISCNVKPSSR